ncbi:hypothetical protein [Tolypothrix sp. PCC 7910]|nr:hypothetical protein [Tolypothrix sp. PCC 7910]
MVVIRGGDRALGRLKSQKLPSSSFIGCISHCDRNQDFLVAALMI